MSKKRKGLVAAAAAFAASPQGRRLLQQAKEYAARPETKERARALVEQARTRASSGRGGTAPGTTTDTTTGTTSGNGTTSGTMSGTTNGTATTSGGAPVYGTPPRTS